MNHPFLSILALASICLLSACGGNDSDHGHPHDDAAPAPHAAESSAGDDAEHGHAHGDGTHSHDGPETEAFYGDDGDEEGPDSTTEHGEDEDSAELHGHDH